MLLRSHSINADDTESELAAIPESPKSDSTLHGSSGGSLGELEDTVPRNALLQEPRMSIISDGTSAIAEPNNRSNANKLRMDSVTKPTWFLGNEDETNQVIIVLQINRVLQIKIDDLKSRFRSREIRTCLRRSGAFMRE